MRLTAALPINIKPGRIFMSALALPLLSLAPLPNAAIAQDATQWQQSGHDIANTRSAPSEIRISRTTAPNLTRTWNFVAQGEVTTTPAVEYGYAYFPDTAGYLYKVRTSDGVQIWRKTLSSMTGTAPVSSSSAVRPISRTTPAISGSRLLVGTRDGFVLAIDKNTGSLLWRRKVDSHSTTMVTASPVVHNGRVFVGVASAEEARSTDSAYTCCTFRGSVVALNLADGAQLWKTFMVPTGYSGGAVWSSSPAVDTKRGSLYVTTGNNYRVPSSVQTCVDNAGTNQTAASACYSSSNWFNAVVSLDLATGRIKWGRRTATFDNWTSACNLATGSTAKTKNCQSTSSPDHDFASGVNYFTAKRNGVAVRDLVGAGRKNGVYYAFNPDNGATVWTRQVGPAGYAGGIQWGSATDGTRVYVAIANSQSRAHRLVPSNETIYWGSWSALNAETGAIIWQTGNPATSNGLAEGPVSVANGVVFGGSMDPSGFMYAFDATNGKILWRFASGGSTISGAAVVGGRVYWGSGYKARGGTWHNRLHAFRIP